MKLLFLSGWYPYPANNGSKLRIYNLLQGLAKQHEVTLITFRDQMETLEPAMELQAICREVRVVPWRPFNPSSRRARFGYFSVKPRMIADLYSNEMADHIKQALSSQHFDLIVASQAGMAMYSHLFRGVPAILEELELGTFYDRYHLAHGWSRIRNGLTWMKHRSWLTSTLKDFRVCTVVSRHERQLAMKAIPTFHPFKVIPNCVQLDEYRDFQASPQANTLIFSGSFGYQPNYEAMCWFLREVFPLIQRQIPGVHLTITGNHGDRALPSHNNVTLTGYVDDVRPYITRSWASLAPIHYGGGTRLKILEAMALGIPVVATTKGAEGLDVRHNEHLLIADTPESYTAEVIHLLCEPGLRARLAKNAYNLMQQHYDWRMIIPEFVTLAEQVVQGSIP